MAMIELMNSPKKRHRRRTTPRRIRGFCAFRRSQYCFCIKWLSGFKYLIRYTQLCISHSLMYIRTVGEIHAFNCALYWSCRKWIVISGYIIRYAQIFISRRPNRVRAFDGRKDATKWIYSFVSLAAHLGIHFLVTPKYGFTQKSRTPELFKRGAPSVEDTIFLYWMGFYFLKRSLYTFNYAERLRVPGDHSKQKASSPEDIIACVTYVFSVIYLSCEKSLKNLANPKKYNSNFPMRPNLRGQYEYSRRAPQNAEHNWRRSGWVWAYKRKSQ